jgi:hypothetical protein
MSWLLKTLFGGGSASTTSNAQHAQQTSQSTRTQAEVESSLQSNNFTIQCQGLVAVYECKGGNPNDLQLLEEHVRLYLLKLTGNFTYEFHLYDSSGTLLLSAPITSGHNTLFDQSAHLILVTVQGAQEANRSFAFKFTDASSEELLKRQWQIDIYESGQRISFNKAVAEKDRQTVFNSYNDNVMMDDSKDADTQPNDRMDFVEEKYMDYKELKEDARAFINPNPTKRQSNNRFFSASAAALDSSDSESESESDSVNSPRRTSNISTMTPGKSQARGKKQAEEEHNDNLAVGMALNRTFVGRGALLGVFKHDDDGNLQYLNRTAVSDRAGQQFTPSKLLLAEQDNKMLMLNRDNPNAVYQMDIERGKVIAEFGGEEDWKIRNIGQTSKYGEKTHDQTILGVNNNSVFTLDPRMNDKNKVAQKFTYQQAPKNTCVAATGAGNVAVGSAKGEIRLFNDISKRAKSLLPGLGDPIIGLDVTEDGSWILATTQRYLLLVPTAIEGNVKDGFSQSLSSAGVSPVKLQLKPADIIKYNIKPEDISFTEAHFNTGDNIREEWIVTSTGPYIITWNFRKLKKNRLNDYKIKLCTNDIIADQFLYGHQDQVVVTLPDNVFVEKRAVKK